MLHRLNCYHCTKILGLTNDPNIRDWKHKCSGYLVGTVEIPDPDLDLVLVVLGTVDLQNDGNVKRIRGLLVGTWNKRTNFHSQ